MRCVIPQPAEQQGMPVYAYHQKIAMRSVRAFHDCLYFVPFDKFRRQRYAFLTSSFLCLGLKLSIVLRSLLPEQCSPPWDFGVDVATIWRQLFLYRDSSQLGVQGFCEVNTGE